MKKNELQLLISFAKANNMMNWPLSAVLNEYLTVKDNHGYHANEE